ncbi:PDZ domain-containing protein [Winogradskyella epiphytica]|uniref:PDZ domain-containing protein n=1 Tax=Winogradskyella epiphytica TaxID=262005 RepID=A0A2V4XMN2_9FLAO|nr:M28 family peptidase [Winogradskyella epiphytica]PYE83339.1 PDZ domain-containing protein [Winogradskyella epiphytica]GGW57466.1 aminopeptidase [Winogradskyella epiphytica]
MKRIIYLLALAGFLSCKTEPKVAENKIQEDVAYLADDKLEGRQTGTEGEVLASEYIISRFKAIGLQPKGTGGYLQSFSFKPKTDPHSEVEFTTNADSTITGHNVLGFIDNNAETTVVIGAHYDHLGYGGEGSLYREENKAVHNGADDNASGVAVMLNLASRLKIKNDDAKVKDKNNYLFMAFSGEEMGLLGSNYFSKNPTIEAQSINYMINMDMVGRMKADSTLAVYGTGTSPRFKQTIKANNNKFKIIENESGVGPSDHTSFYLIDIPVLHFFTGQHEDYHKPGDDPEKLNYEGMNLISDYIYNIIKDLDDDGKLAFRKTKNESDETPRFKVGLGVVPDYLYDGKGMRIDGTREDTPATAAGLQKGDVVLKLGDSTITDMMSYMRALSVFDNGDEAEIIVKRGEETLEKKVKF